MSNSSAMLHLLCVLRIVTYDVGRGPPSHPELPPKRPPDEGSARFASIAAGIVGETLVVTLYLLPHYPNTYGDVGETVGGRQPAV